MHMPTRIGGSSPCTEHGSFKGFFLTPKDNSTRWLALIRKMTTLLGQSWSPGRHNSIKSARIPRPPAIVGLRIQGSASQQQGQPRGRSLPQDLGVVRPRTFRFRILTNTDVPQHAGNLLNSTSVATLSSSTCLHNTSCKS